MRKTSFSKYMIALLLTVIMMLSCLGTAAAASIQEPQDDVTETETMLQESQNQDAQESGLNVPQKPGAEAAELQETEALEQMPEVPETEQVTEVSDTEETAAESEEALTPAETDSELTSAEAVIPADADVNAKAEAEVQTADEDSITGAVLEDGVYVYYENGVKTEKTGLAKAVDNTGWYYMENGEHNSSAEGICKRIDGVGGWYYVRNGKYRTDLTGIAKKVDRTGGWYYVKNGVYKTNVTGISKKIDGTGGWYYVKNGVYTTSATGIAKRADGVGGWYYVKNGVYNTNATGIAKKADGTGGWYYVRKGVYKTDVTGICKKADGTGGWYYVKNGVYNTNATGITWKADSTDTRFYYVQKGVYKPNASGIAKQVTGDPGWFYVRNGVYRPGASGIAKKADGSSSTWFYVEAGYYDTSFNGLARKADCSSDTQFYVKNGIFTKSNISSYEYSGGTYKITDGVASLKSGVKSLWVQDFGSSYVYHDGYSEIYYSLKVKNTDVNYPLSLDLRINCYSASGNVIDYSEGHTSVIAPGDTVYCTYHFHSTKEPADIGAELQYEYNTEESIKKVSAYPFSNTSQRKYESYTRYTGTIKNNSGAGKSVCVNVIYYKDGQMVGGYNEYFNLNTNQTITFTMDVDHEPDYDSYKLFITQLYP